jgi:hypothetical protein
VLSRFIHTGDMDDDEIQQYAIQGWTAYVQQVTKREDPAMPVDDRMIFALAGEELPDWLLDGIRARLDAARTSG